MCQCDNLPICQLKLAINGQHCNVASFFIAERRGEGSQKLEDRSQKTEWIGNEFVEKQKGRFATTLISYKPKT
jgi:hypothetical protein